MVNNCDCHVVIAILCRVSQGLLTRVVALHTVGIILIVNQYASILLAMLVVCQSVPVIDVSLKLSYRYYLDMKITVPDDYHTAPVG